MKMESRNEEYIVAKVEGEGNQIEKGKNKKPTKVVN